jgi:hypothetical protein
MHMYGINRSTSKQFFLQFYEIIIGTLSFHD